MKAILFDLDNTLIDRDAALLSAAGRLARQPQSTVDAPAGIPPSLAPREPVLCYARRLAIRIGTAQNIGALAAQLRRGLIDAIAPDARVLDLLGRLAQRYRLGIVTNGSSRVQRAKLARAALTERVNAIVISGELGQRKPQPGIFVHALAEIGATPAETLVVGDDPRTDIAAAQRLGMKSFWICRGETYPIKQAPPDDSGPSVLGLDALL